MGLKWGQELLKAKTIIAEQHQTIEKLKGEIAIIKTPLLERANALVKKIDPTISVSEENSIAKLKILILELETRMELETDDEIAYCDCPDCELKEKEEGSD